MSDKIKTLFDQVLRPLVAADGGCLELVDVVDKRVRVRMTGTCAGCPGRPFTLERVLEPAVQRWLGSEYTVEAIGE